MRIQQTDAVLKESRNRRRSAPKPHGFFSRLWHMVTGLFR